MNTAEIKTHAAEINSMAAACAKTPRQFHHIAATLEKVGNPKGWDGREGRIVATRKAVANWLRFSRQDWKAAYAARGA